MEDFLHTFFLENEEQISETKLQDDVFLLSWNWHAKTQALLRKKRHLKSSLSMVLHSSLHNTITVKAANMSQLKTLWNPSCMHISKTPLTTTGTQALLVVNSFKLHLTAFNNFIQELPLLAASSWMETIPVAGKSWKPRHEPLRQAQGTLSRTTACLENQGLMWTGNSKHAEAPC